MLTGNEDMPAACRHDLRSGVTCPAIRLGPVLCAFPKIEAAMRYDNFFEECGLG